MKILHLFVRIFVITIVFLGLFSCEDKTPNNRHIYYTLNDSEFQSHVADSIITKLNKDEQLDFFIELVGITFSNINDLDNWLVDKKIGVDKLNSTTKKNKLYTFCKALYNAQLPNSKYNLVNQIEKYGHENNDASLQGVALISIIEHYADHFKTDSMEYYLDELHGITERDSSQWLLSIYHNKRAYFHSLNSNYFEAILDYNLALNNLNKENQNLKGLIYHDLAVAYFNLEWYDKAQVFIDSAIQIDGVEKHYKSRINLAALIYSKNGNFIKAQNLLLTIINESAESVNSLLLAQTYSNYGNLMRKMKKYNEALLYMSKSDSLSVNIQLEMGIVLNSINRAELYLENNQFQLALKEVFTLGTRLEKYGE